MGIQKNAIPMEDSRISNEKPENFDTPKRSKFLAPLTLDMLVFLFLHYLVIEKSWGKPRNTNLSLTDRKRLPTGYFNGARKK